PHARRGAARTPASAPAPWQRYRGLGDHSREELSASASEHELRCIYMATRLDDLDVLATTIRGETFAARDLAVTYVGGRLVAPKLVVRGAVMQLVALDPLPLIRRDDDYVPSRL